MVCATFEICFLQARDQQRPSQTARVRLIVTPQGLDARHRLSSAMARGGAKMLDARLEVQKKEG